MLADPHRQVMSSSPKTPVVQVHLLLFCCYQNTIPLKKSCQVQDRDWFSEW